MVVANEPRRLADGGRVRPAYRRSMTAAAYHHPSRREILSDLFARLSRVQAATGTVRALVRAQDSSATTLSDALQALERDLALAARDAETARAALTR